MAISKITVNEITNMDVTSDTVDAEHLLYGYTAHDASGTQITGTYVGSTPSMQTKTATPTTSQQIITPDSGYNGLSQVTINPIPSQYIVPTGTKSITANGTGIDVTEYAAVDVAVSGGGAEVPTFTLVLTYVDDQIDSYTITCDKTYSECYGLVSNNGMNAALLNTSVTGEDGSWQVGLAGGYRALSLHSGLLRYMSYDGLKPYYQIDYMSDGTISFAEIPSDLYSTLEVTENGTYTAEGYDLYSEVIVNVHSSAPSLQSKSVSYTPSETAQSATVTADSGYDGLSSVDVSVGAISSTYVGSGITQRSSTDLTASGATVTAPAGYYASAATKSVASGTEGTPTATKGSVSNHTISVTPSVTNSAGYITGSTKTGTAVSVSASELVSGTYTVSASGTHNVTNYASASVTEGSATAPSSINGTAAAITTGTNTLTLTKTVSITPSVTAGYISTGTEGNSSVSLTASVPTKAAATITPSTTNQTIAAGTYLTGTQTIAGDADLVASNIISTANIFGVQGSVVIQNYYTGSSAPSSSLGQNGDIYLQE